MPAKEPTPFRRCQRPPGVTDWYLRTPAAALLVAPGATVSHHSAARLWGGVVPDDGFVHLACPNRRPQVDGIKAHRASASGRTTTWRGLVVTTPVQTFLDLAPHLGLVDLVVLEDSLVKQKRLTPEHLVEAATAHRGAGARLARRAAGLVRDEVDSAMESRLRLLLVLAGLPEPSSTTRSTGLTGRFVTGSTSATRTTVW
jgi:hypothetical protein